MSYARRLSCVISQGDAGGGVDTPRGFRCEIGQGGFRCEICPGDGGVMCEWRRGLV